jgi:hypothetical protein
LHFERIEASFVRDFQAHGLSTAVMRSRGLFVYLVADSVTVLIKIFGFDLSVLMGFPVPEEP